MKKKIFLVSTELGRKRGRISFYIAEIIPNEGLRLIDNDFTCQIRSHKGIKHEAINLLVSKGELPPEALYEDGYINYDFKDDNYILINIEGEGLNYVDQI